jgi:hypothetical protein
MPKKKKDKDMSAQELIEEVEEEEEARAKKQSAQELIDEVEREEKPKRVAKIVETKVKAPQDIESLRQDIETMERQQEMAKERAKLMQRKKQLQFQTTPLGKVTKGIGGFFEKLTRPKPKKPMVAGQKPRPSGILGVLEKLTRPKPVQPAQRVPVHTGISAGEPTVALTSPRKTPQQSFEETQRQISQIANFGVQRPQPVEQMQRPTADVGQQLRNLIGFGVTPAPRQVQGRKVAKVKAKIGKRRLKGRARVRQPRAVQPRQPPSISDILKQLPP